VEAGGDVPHIWGSGITALNQHLDRQVVEIPDRTHGDTSRGIVQMAPPADVTQHINATSWAVAEQGQATTARSLVSP
jgi:hypothetical protein